jgi:hypothetical protein
VSHYEIEIKEKTIIIDINKKIYELEKENLIDLFLDIKAFNSLEKKKYSNEYLKGILNIKYKTNVLNIEYVNVYKIIRNPSPIEFFSYFLKFKENFSEQSNDTKINLNDYFVEIDTFSQKILIEMDFKIKATILEIKEKKEELKKKYLLDDSLYDLINDIIKNKI